MNKNVKILLIVLVLFVASLAIYYYPVYKKGYSFGFNGGNLILARNFAETGQYNTESPQNIILNSQLSAQEGMRYNPGNELTYTIYGYIFKHFGFQQQLPLFISIFLWSLSSVLLFFLVKKQFNLKVAVIFGVVSIFLPVILQGVLTGGFYEWAVLCFSIALCLFFNIKERFSWLSLVLAGVFFALSILCRSAFIVSVIPFVIFEFYRNRSIKKLVYLSLPIILILGLFFGRGMLDKEKSGYFSGENLNFVDYSHLYPDPYTFHFEKEQYLKELEGTSNTMFSQFLLKYGEKVSLKNQIIMYLGSAKFYPKEFLKLIISGGPLILLLMFFGFLYLFKKNKQLFKFFILWFIIWYVLLVILKTNNWDHFLELSWPIVLLISLGIYSLFDFIYKSDLKKNLKYILFVLISLCIVLHFIQANKWMLHEEYNTSNIDSIIVFTSLVEKESLSNKDIIAVGWEKGMPFALNYLTNKNFVYFHPETVKKLLAENSLQSAFDKFGVTHIIAFDHELTREIQENSQVKVIK
ncbi:MAG: glycosyltransferase family 39 protein [Patescibacteria group bacterium]